MERDDVYEYSLDAHHSEEEGRKIRSRIWFVTWLLTAITVAEVLLGVYYADMNWLPWTAVKIIFIGLTLVKAAYIVLVFMHLGDERSSFRWVILGPYILFIAYLLFIIFQEATYIEGMDFLFGQ